MEGEKKEKWQKLKKERRKKKLIKFTASPRGRAGARRKMIHGA